MAFTQKYLGEQLFAIVSQKKCQLTPIARYHVATSIALQIGENTVSSLSNLFTRKKLESRFFKAGNALLKIR